MICYNDCRIVQRLLETLERDRDRVILTGTVSHHKGSIRIAKKKPPQKITDAAGCWGRNWIRGRVEDVEVTLSSRCYFFSNLLQHYHSLAYTIRTLMCISSRPISHALKVSLTAVYTHVEYTLQREFVEKVVEMPVRSSSRRYSSSTVVGTKATCLHRYVGTLCTGAVLGSWRGD